jgi:hypothetical protein
VELRVEYYRRGYSERFRDKLGRFYLNPDNAAEIKMKAISPLTDFSFDFQDMDFKRQKSKNLSPLFTHIEPNAGAFYFQQIHGMIQFTQF